MCRLRPAICIVLTLLILFFISIDPATAKNVNAPNSVITAHEPKTRMSEVKRAPGKKSSKTWLWVIIGAAVIAGCAAAFAGGDGGSGSSDVPQSDEGSISANW